MFLQLIEASSPENRKKCVKSYKSVKNSALPQETEGHMSK